MSWRDWFKAPARVVVYKLIEVEARTHTRWDKESKDAVSTLQSHPGFLALLDKLKLQRGIIENTLKSTRHQDIRAVDFLQSGIYWAGWLQREVEATTLKGPTKQYKDPMQEELEAFQAIDAQIERVGME
jgi:hypothetical protein